MSELLRVISSFRKGSLSQQALLAELERQLDEQSADPVAMLAILDEEHARQALPGQVHSMLAQRILKALDVSAVAVGAGSLVAANEEPTLFIRDPDRPMASAGSAQDQDGVDASGEWNTGRVRTIGTDTVLKHRFKLQECVGEGGMGRVYKAIDLRRVEARAQDVHVAVKVLTKSFRDYSGSLVVLQREATKLQKLTHPNIVRVIDVDRDGQTVFMTMEYLSGQPLKRLFGPTGARAIEEKQALRLLDGIAAALSFAHRNEIVHGDLKPSNIIVTDSREVKVIDFGIARVMANSAKSTPGAATLESESLSGLTPSYASPEMLDHQPPDARDDVYGLACIAHEMLTGVHPFGRQASTLARDAGVKLRRRAGLSRTQFNALQNGLQFDRTSRTPTVERFMQELRGDRAAFARRRAVYAALILLVLAGGAYVFNRVQTAVSSKALAAGDVFRDCPTCPLMKVLPAGRFEQGSADEEADAQSFEKPRHAVTIAHPFGFGVQEVTREQFKEFVDESKQQVKGCSVYDGEWRMRADLDWSHVGFAQTASHPVACVSWQDAKAYAAWLSKKTHHLYRLPSASEWEYAARSGSSAPRPWGNNPAEACTVANVADEAAGQRFPGWQVHACNDGYVFTAPVGAFAANTFGLSDLFGNVFEWVEDCWHDTYQGAPSDGSSWAGGDCAQREMRGGSWFTSPEFVRAAYRNRFEPDYRSNSIGFRLVRDVSR